MDFSSFMKQNAVQTEDVTYPASKRFLKEDGSVDAFTLHAITSEKDAEIRKSCTREVKVPGKRHAYTSKLDVDSYSAKVAAACVVYPNLYNAELQDSYGVKEPEALLRAMLLPGELTALTAKVQEICGFDIGMEELVDEVKN